MNATSQSQATFTLTVDSQEMRVRYKPNYIGGTDPYALIEFTSPHEPPRRIPVSETGYRSFFAPMSEIEEPQALRNTPASLRRSLSANDAAPK